MSGIDPKIPALSLLAPNLLIFDSGLGGLTVLEKILALLPHANLWYVADDAAFPYGRLREDQILKRSLHVLEKILSLHAFDVITLACHTASTLALASLRYQWPELFFVGTVPAIKPATQVSKTKMISVLATPSTIARDYTQKLIGLYATDCAVHLVAAPNLAQMAEDFMRGKSLNESDVFSEIAFCFQEIEGLRTDTIVLACTHYPLLLPLFHRLAPWPVHWIDPAPAIARRVQDILATHFPAHSPASLDSLSPLFTHFPSWATQDSSLISRKATFTSNRPPDPPLISLLKRFKLHWESWEAIPFSGEE